MKNKANFLAVLMVMTALVLSACGGKGDTEIQREVNEKLKASPSTSAVTAAVKDGVVTLSGNVADNNARNAALAAARSIEGQKEVKDVIEIKPTTPVAPPVVTNTPSATNPITTTNTNGRPAANTPRR